MTTSLSIKNKIKKEHGMRTVKKKIQLELSADNETFKYYLQLLSDAPVVAELLNILVPHPLTHIPRVAGDLIKSMVIDTDYGYSAPYPTSDAVMYVSRSGNTTLRYVPTDGTVPWLASNDTIGTIHATITIDVTVKDNKVLFADIGHLANKIINSRLMTSSYQAEDVSPVLTKTKLTDLANEALAVRSASELTWFSLVLHHPTVIYELNYYQENHTPAGDMFIILAMSEHVSAEVLWALGVIRTDDMLIAVGAGNFIDILTGTTISPSIVINYWNHNINNPRFVKSKFVRDVASTQDLFNLVQEGVTLAGRDSWLVVNRLK